MSRKPQRKPYPENWITESLTTEDLNNAITPSNLTAASIRDALDKAGPNGAVELKYNETYLIEEEPPLTATLPGGDVRYGVPITDYQTLSLNNSLIKTADDFDTDAEWFSPIGNADPENGNEGLSVFGPGKIDCNQSKLTGVKQWEGVNFKGVSDYHLKNFEIVNAPTEAVDFDDCESPGTVERVVVRDSAGASFHPSAGTGELELIDCWSFNAATQGYRLVGGSQDVIMRGCWSVNDNQGVRFDGNETRAENCTVLNPTNEAYVVIQSLTRCMIHGGRVQGGPNTLFDFSAANRSVSIKDLWVEMDNSEGNPCITGLPPNSEVADCYVEESARFIVCESGAAQIKISDNFARSTFYPVDANGASVIADGNDWRGAGSYPFIRNATSDSVINGVTEESADAEEPQRTDIQVGTEVDFTDTGDGSGTGLYKLMPDESWKQLDG